MGITIGVFFAFLALAAIATLVWVVVMAIQDWPYIYADDVLRASIIGIELTAIALFCGAMSYIAFTHSP